jgi:hypothetical protein
MLKKFKNSSTKTVAKNPWAHMLHRNQL